MPSGRTRVYKDTRERKRANKERLQQKARESYHARRKQEIECAADHEDSGNDDPEDADDDPIADYYYLHRVKKVLGPDMVIDAMCDWDGLLRALRKDLTTWRGDFDEDDACYREYTKLAIDLSHDGRPVSVIEEIMHYPFSVLKQIHALASAAANGCVEARGEGDDDAVELSHGFTRVSNDADLMECALREVLTLFRDSPHTLEDQYYKKGLMWQFL